MIQKFYNRGCNDKLLHMCISFIIATVSGVLLAHIPPHNSWIVSGCAFATAFLIGVGKEIYDKHNGGHFSLLDLLADAIGATGGMAIAWLAAYVLSA